MIKVLKADLVEAMKNKDVAKRDILRLFLGMLDTERAKLKLDDVSKLTEEQIITFLNRQKNQLKEEIEGVKKAGKDFSTAEKQMEVIMSYLPKQLTEAEIVAEIEKVFNEGVEMNLGKTMAKLKHLKGKADMSHVNKLVREHFAK